MISIQLFSEFPGHLDAFPMGFGLELLDCLLKDLTASIWTLLRNLNDVNDFSLFILSI